VTRTAGECGVRGAGGGPAAVPAPGYPGRGCAGRRRRGGGGCLRRGTRRHIFRAANGGRERRAPRTSRRRSVVAGGRGAASMNSGRTTSTKARRGPQPPFKRDGPATLQAVAARYRTYASASLRCRRYDRPSSSSSPSLARARLYPLLRSPLSSPVRVPHPPRAESK
jgi:hypothetical protein